MIRSVVGLDMSGTEILEVLEEHERELVYPEFDDATGKC
jgi:hypothetical protein